MPVPSVESDEFSLTVGSDGPILLQDHYLIEQMANFNRERIPERQPHAKGGGRPPAPSCRRFPLLSSGRWAVCAAMRVRHRAPDRSS